MTTTQHYHDIPSIKERILIPEVWRALRLEGEAAERCRSPFREDKNPSFSIYKGGRQWKDFATGAGGDVIDFIAMARQVGKGEALKLFLELAGVPMKRANASAGAGTRSKTQQGSYRIAGGSANAPAQAQRMPVTPAQPTRHTAEVLPAEPQRHAAADSHAEPQQHTARDSRSQMQTQAQGYVRGDSHVGGPHPDGLRVPLQNGAEKDRLLVAESRHIVLEAVSLALALRTLTFAIVQGYRCWVLTDAAERIAEARRLDGMPFPEAGPLGRRKAHTLRGSRKNWPVGVAVLRRIPQFRTLLLVEGGPDYLAALHFAHEMERWDVLPVAMLGRSAGTQMDAAALELMRGRRVRIYPHADADGGGVQSARVWATQLAHVGCEVDIYDLCDLHRTDGKPIKDLNDCTTGLDEKSAAELRERLLPRADAEVDPPF